MRGEAGVGSETDDAGTPFSEVPFLVVDVETTGCPVVRADPW